MGGWYKENFMRLMSPRVVAWAWVRSGGGNMGRSVGQDKSEQERVLPWEGAEDQQCRRTLRVDRMYQCSWLVQWFNSLL